MESTLICPTVLIVIFSRTVFSIITVVSNVEETLINGTAFFNCSTSSTSGHVDWFFGSDVIYSYGKVHSVYTDRFRVEVYTTNNGFKHFNLILWLVTKDDAGQYICKDSDNVDDKGEEVNLIVLETGPNCAKDGYSQEVIGPNSCGIEQEMVHLSCSVEYSGNKPPSLLWKKVGENNSMEPVLCFDSGHSYTCNLTLKSDLQIEGSSYICQTNGSAPNQYNCTSDHIKITYALADYTEINATVNDLASCTVKSSRACNYAWKFNNSEQLVADSQDVNLTRVGSYRCQANCSMSDKNCTITVKMAFVSSNITEANVAPTTDITTAIVASIVVPVAVVCALIGLLSVVIYKKRKVICKNCKKNEGHCASKAEREGLELLSSDVDNYKESRLHKVKMTLRPTEITLDDVEGKSDPNPTSDSLEARNYKKRIRGLTLLKNKLYITTERSNRVEVFDSMTKMIKETLTLEGLQDPGTIASCTINNCIYIIDKKMLEDKAEIFKCCPCKESAWKWTADYYGRLSVTKVTGNVVLAAYYRGQKHMLKIFSTYGNLLRTVAFSERTKIEYLWHAVALNQGDFLVSHGCFFEEESHWHRVCIVSNDGNTIKKSFGKERGPNINKLQGPSCLAVTADGSILVADMKNHRVILLNKDLKFKKIIYKTEKYCPEIMFLDEQNNLFVGENLKVDKPTINFEGRVLCLKI